MIDDIRSSTTLSEVNRSSVQPMSCVCVCRCHCSCWAVLVATLGNIGLQIPYATSPYTVTTGGTH